MKKILILTYDFPPFTSVGSLRPYSWYKYLKEFNVYPIVVTRQWDCQFGNKLDYIAPGSSSKIIIEKNEYGTIIKTPYTPNISNKILLKHGEKKYKFIRNFFSTYYEIIQWFSFTGSKSQIYNTAKSYLKSNKIDIIIATGDPFILFKYAAKLSAKYKIPWIADYRDPWSFDITLEKKTLFKIWSRFFEKKIVRTCSSITTVADFVRTQLPTNILRKMIHIIPNGYDQEIIESTKNTQPQNCELNIAFAGTIYKERDHPFESFLSTVSKFLYETNTQLKINFYGINISDELKKIILAKYFNLINVVNIFPRIPNNKLLLELSKNDVMLLFNDYFFISTKTFEYIGLKRKILLCYTNATAQKKLINKYFKKKIFNINMQSQEDLITNTNSGFCIKNEEHLWEVLLNLKVEFEEKRKIECHSINTEQYSRKIQVEKLAGIINKITPPYTVINK
ncbi:MAG: hypothetical protein A2275_12030 [Bacteroidetes bacterium RIFOXYA12_FULL_35_11]|nr:MAG: hypothetical protein A2X01_17320 [Bacteroidetes bacterium GWF2_35_48]OFY77644.1 MAG: hypothetical protein A2275_12030 [Bacteroidetes bacterium RIFOXYA12_FULL_35_11]OFY94081.1 MAG: hypothetical protein A2309_11620 [Bacteroidetes bacterium RIFOXYB2_FULL_35_7]OFZ00135.1 MAG: hypothetical protein A2491_19385 [Bacteroidetes bacterium RIFOXYC12_FULL_35_7]HBX53001.1 hypothetical protein [Bacteroidales bacterium]